MLTLQLKRVILENYDAVIPHHARQLVLQLGQEHCERWWREDDKGHKTQSHVPDNKRARNDQKNDERGEGKSGWRNTRNERSGDSGGRRWDNKNDDKQREWRDGAGCRAHVYRRFGKGEIA